MKDIKNFQKLNNVKVLKPAQTSAKFDTTLKFNNFKLYNYFALGFASVLLIVYVGSMVSISIFAIQEKNYTFKTSELRSQQIAQIEDLNSDSLALSNLNLNKSNMLHIYVDKTGEMSSFSQR